MKLKLSIYLGAQAIFVQNTLKQQYGCYNTALKQKLFRVKQRRAKGLIDFERHEDDELGFRKNDLITVNFFVLTVHCLT